MVTLGQDSPPQNGLAGYWKGLILAPALFLGVVGYLGSQPPDRDPPSWRQIYTQPVDRWPAPWVDGGIEAIELGAADLPAIPDPQTPQGLRYALGERLFNDPVLSQSGHFSCQSCHNRRLGWGDGLPRSFGHARAEGTRNAPALFAAGRRPHLFWDGRASSLQEQAQGPTLAGNELANHDLTDVAAWLRQAPDYPALFRQSYGDQPITFDLVADALAVFQTHLDRTTRFDVFMQGRHDVLSDEQIHGLHLFRTKGRCMNCHFGADLTDNKFHNLGLSYIGRKYEDLGRYNVTGNPEDAGKFLTPSLRHLNRTGPYMHNGLFPSLRGLVNLYAFGMGRSHSRALTAQDEPLLVPASTSSPHVKRLELSPKERRALTRFLEAL